MNSTLIILGLIAAVIVLFAFYLILSKSAGESDRQWKLKARNHLSIVLKNTDKNNPVSLKNSLVELDKLLDFVMKSKKLKGDTMGERLKNARSIFDKSMYNKIWDAHKLRNTMVHEIDYKLNPNELIMHISTLRKAVDRVVE